MLEQNFPLLWVSGEISNFTRAASGHWYFTLKDQDAPRRAVMFRGRAQYVSFMPRKVTKVEVRAWSVCMAPWRFPNQCRVCDVQAWELVLKSFLRLKSEA